MSTHHTKVLIIGAGPAGYTAAIYAARANLKPLLLTGIQPGGQLTITTDVENYPGFAEPVQGPWLMEQMRQQAVNVGTQLVYDTITSVDLSKRPFRAQGDSGDTYVADGLIIATGAQARWLGIPSEMAFNGYGVSACATCDGFFYRDKEVVVVGGGNTAVEEALYLSKIASKVTVIHRRDRFRAEPILQDRLLAKPNVEVVWNHVIEEVLGEHEPTKSVTGVRIRDVKQVRRRSFPHTAYSLQSVMIRPPRLFRGQLDMDEAGYIKVGSWSTKTSVPGCQAAGDVIDPVFRQAISSAGMGCMAALEADKFLAENPSDPDKRA